MIQFQFTRFYSHSNFKNSFFLEVHIRVIRNYSTCTLSMKMMSSSFIFSVILMSIMTLSKE